MKGGVGSRNKIKNLIIKVMRHTRANLPFVILKWPPDQFMDILKLLQYEGLIQSFEKKGTYVIIRLRQTFFKRLLNPVASMQSFKAEKKENVRHTLRAKKLRRTSESYRSCIINILNTDRGIISHKKALQENVGGIPLIQIN